MPIRVPVKEIMIKQPLVVDKETPVDKTAKLMAERRVGSVIVLDKNRPIGIVTDTDLTKRVVALAKDPKKLKVKEIMSAPLVFISPDDDYSIAVEKMKKHRIKRIPVIRKGKVVGILTTTDITRTIPDMLDLLEARLLMREKPPKIEETSTSGICEICGNYSENLTYENDQWVCEECKET